MRNSRNIPLNKGPRCYNRAGSIVPYINGLSPGENRGLCQSTYRGYLQVRWLYIIIIRRGFYYVAILTMRNFTMKVSQQFFLFSWVVKGGAVEDCWGTAVIERADIPKL